MPLWLPKSRSNAAIAVMATPEQEEMYKSMIEKDPKSPIFGMNTDTDGNLPASYGFPKETVIKPVWADNQTDAILKMHRNHGGKFDFDKFFEATSGLTKELKDIFPELTNDKTAFTDKLLQFSKSELSEDDMNKITDYIGENEDSSIGELLDNHSNTIAQYELHDKHSDKALKLKIVRHEGGFALSSSKKSWYFTKEQLPYVKSLLKQKRAKEYDMSKFYENDITNTFENKGAVDVTNDQLHRDFIEKNLILDESGQKFNLSKEIGYDSENRGLTQENTADYDKKNGIKIIALHPNDDFDNLLKDNENLTIGLRGFNTISAGGLIEPHASLQSITQNQLKTLTNDKNFFASSTAGIYIADTIAKAANYTNESRFLGGDDAYPEKYYVYKGGKYSAIGVAITHDMGKFVTTDKPFNTNDELKKYLADNELSHAAGVLRQPTKQNGFTNLEAIVKHSSDVVLSHILLIPNRSIAKNMKENPNWYNATESFGASKGSKLKKSVWESQISSDDAKNIFDDSRDKIESRSKVNDLGDLSTQEYLSKQSKLVRNGDDYEFHSSKELKALVAHADLGNGKKLHFVSADSFDPIEHEWLNNKYAGVSNGDGDIKLTSISDELQKNYLNAYGVSFGTNKITAKQYVKEKAPTKTQKQISAPADSPLISKTIQQSNETPQTAEQTPIQIPISVAPIPSSAPVAPTNNENVSSSDLYHYNGVFYGELAAAHSKLSDMTAETAHFSRDDLGVDNYKEITHSGDGHKLIYFERGGRSTVAMSKDGVNFSNVTKIFVKAGSGGDVNKPEVQHLADANSKRTLARFNAISAKPEFQ